MERGNNDRKCVYVSETATWSSGKEDILKQAKVNENVEHAKITTLPNKRTKLQGMGLSH